MNEASVSSLAIEAVDRRDSGLYSCRASNAFGSDETSIQLVVQGSCSTQFLLSSSPDALLNE